MAHVVFSKILGKKQKGLQIFTISDKDKKFTTQSKKLQKMQKKQLIDEIEHMQKYMTNLTHKLEQGKKLCQKFIDKCEESTQKLNVVNSKMANISNQHQQLQVKFSNLQSSLQQMTREKEIVFKNQLQYVQGKQLVKQKIFDISGILKIYRDQVVLVEKIAAQNKQLKQRYSQLESDFFALSDQFALVQAKNSKLQNQQRQKQNAQNKGCNTNYNGNGNANTSPSVGQDTQPDNNEQNNQHKLLLQNKQQMIALLNKKIAQQNTNKIEQDQKIDNLHHEIQQKQTQIRHKQQQLGRLCNQINQLKKKISMIKQNNQKLQIGAEQAKQQIKRKGVQIQQLNNQLIQIRYKLKCNEEQKKILINNYSQKLLNTEEQEQKRQRELQLQLQKVRYQIQAKDRQLENYVRKMRVLDQQIKSLQSNLAEFKIIEKENLKNKEILVEQKAKYQQLVKKMQNMQENYQIKLKKLQFNVNQQRIKADALKRSLTNLQVKQEESRKQLNQMYQKKMIQDNKYAKMQNKLKQYKNVIQYLKKQKVQLQKTFQTKMKNMQQIVLNQVEEQQHQSSSPSDRNQRNITQEDQALISKLNSIIADLQEQVVFLKEQNKMLANQKNQLQESNLELQKGFKIMSNKRQEVMKQINKIASLNMNVNMSKNQVQDQFSVRNRERQKKIVEKALKGFNILSKLLTTVYKQFINLHINDINKAQVKELQGNINTLVGKCQDMKDIFQGYL